MLTVTTTQSHSHGVINGRLVRALSRCFQTLNVPLSVGPERTWISIDFNAIPSAAICDAQSKCSSSHPFTPIPIRPRCWKTPWAPLPLDNWTSCSWIIRIIQYLYSRGAPGRLIHFSFKRLFQRWRYVHKHFYHVINNSHVYSLSYKCNLTHMLDDRAVL